MVVYLNSWHYFNSKGIDFKNKRTGEITEIKEVDMVFADGNRVLIKKQNSNELHYALLQKSLIRIIFFILSMILSLN